MERPDLTGLNKKQSEYLNYLESVVNGTSNLLKELNHLNDVIAADIRKIADGDDVEIYIDDKGKKQEKSTLSLLCPDKDDKTFDKIMKIIGSYDRFKAIGITKTDQADAPKSQATIKNIQDFTLNKDK